MNKRFKILLTILFILLLLVGVVFYFWKNGIERMGLTGIGREKIQVIYTADMQGSILDLPCNKAGSNLQFYTIPQIAEEVDSIREDLAKKGIAPIIIDGGNTLFGVDDLSWSQDGDPAFHLLKSSGYVAMAAGRSEFLMGSRWIMDKKGELRIFSGNSLLKKGRLQFKSTPHDQVKGDFSRSFSTTVDGRKISFFSYFEPRESPLLPGVKEEYMKADFDPSIDNLNRQVESDGGDINIVLARVNNIGQFVKKIKGAHIVIPGRYHDSLPSGKVTKIDGVNILPFINSRYMGVARIGINKKKDGNVDVKITFRKPESKGEKKIAGLKLYLDKFYKKYGGNYGKVHTAFLGYGNETLKHTTGVARETPTAFVITDMIRNYSGADVVLINLFSIRKPLSGIIRGEYVEWIMPFENKLVTMDLTGSQIEEIMKLNLRRDTKFMVMSGGQIKYGPGKKITLYIDGIPIDRKKTYRVATNDYLAKGEKIEYRAFRMGKNVHRTEIPLNGIFLEALLRRRYIGMPPERVGIKSREEIEGIKDVDLAIREAGKWGYYNLVFKISGDPKKPTDLYTECVLIPGIYLYCGLPGYVKNDSWMFFYSFSSKLPNYAFDILCYSLYAMMDYNILLDYEREFHIGFPHTVKTLFCMALYRLGETAKASRTLNRISKLCPSDIRLRRLASAVAGSGEKVAQELPVWAKFKGDLRNTGRSSSTGPHSKKVNVLWKFKTFHSIKSSPAIAEDGTIYIGGGDGNLYALFPDGKLKWKYTLGGYILSSPAIGMDGTIYVGSGASESGSKRRTFGDNNRRVGRPAATHAEGGSGRPAVTQIEGAPGGMGRPAATQTEGDPGGMGRPAATQMEGDPGDMGRPASTPTSPTPGKSGFFYALNPDGTVKWRKKTGGWVASSPLVTPGGNIIVGCNDSYVYCFTSDGDIKWKFKTGSKVFPSPALGDDGTVYIGSEDFYFYAIDNEGKEKWKYKADNKFFSSAAVADDGTIYTGNDDSHLYAFKPDGGLIWKKKFPAPITSTPSIGTDGDLYIGCEDGKLYRMTPDRDVKWTFDREDEFFSSPIIDKDGYIYIGCEDNYLYCISPEGKLAWKFETGDYVESTPVAAPGGKVYLGAEDHYFYVLTGK
ncbi:MAG: PQQ-binding-like beta-propeller repeat protein [Candidatus Eremiobacteraeota bacterium]|nr:PQQ-binding-like beta-propeller repeat protein [Candidatus Eremiobacteraeota bacterium]